MKKWIVFIGIAFMLAGFVRLSLGRPGPGGGFDLRDPLIRLTDIESGGPPKDGIPSLTDPAFVPAGMAHFLQPDDRILGLYYDGIAKAYPVKILTWHEAVNDRIGETPILATY